MLIGLFFRISHVFFSLTFFGCSSLASRSLFSGPPPSPPFKMRLSSTEKKNEHKSPFITMYTKIARKFRLCYSTSGQHTTACAHLCSISYQLARIQVWPVDNFVFAGPFIGITLKILPLNGCAAESYSDSVASNGNASIIRIADERNNNKKWKLPKPFRFH